MRDLYKMASVLLVLYFSACSPNDVTVDNSLKKYFDDNHVAGTFGLLDNAQGQFTVCNLYRFKDSVYLPGTAFDIVNAVVGLETGRINNENMVIPLAGPGGGTVKTPLENVTMQAAFATQAVAYFKTIARRIGKDTMQHWLDTLGYGARYGKVAIKSAVDTFWLDNTVKITADEQMGLVKKLYFGQLPFQKRTQDIVKKIMPRQQTPKYKLSYATGQGVTEKGDALGWVSGWIEENNHVYFFSMNLQGPAGTDTRQAGMSVLNSILKQQGFFEGRR